MLSTEQRILNIEKAIERIEKMMCNYLIEARLPSSKWVPESQAMRTLTLSKKSLQRLRVEGSLRYSTASGKNIKYWQPDLEKYLSMNSNIKTKIPT
jgi:hypothetical protein